MRNNIKSLSLFLLILIIIFIVSYYVNLHISDSNYRFFNFSVLVIQTIASLVMLLIALFLYDKFGLDKKIIEKQTEKVLELVEILKNTNFRAKGEKMDYFIRFGTYHIDGIRSIPGYNTESNKRILICPNLYGNKTREINFLMNNYLLPYEIKEKLKFLELSAIGEDVDILNGENKKNFIQLNTLNYTGSIKKWSVMLYPDLKFGDFVDNVYLLTKEVEEWVEKHTNIDMDLFGDQFISKKIEESKPLSNLKNIVLSIKRRLKLKRNTK